MVLKKMMGCYAVLFLLIIVDINGVWSISREEDLEMERQLKILNKPGVKTIRTDYGYIYDCVDIHKQPSLDHPLLKNHKVQMTFDHFPKSVKDKPSKEKELSSILGKGLGCPTGTVPIQRIKKEDLIRAKDYSKFRAKRYAENSHLLDNDSNNFRSAKIYTNRVSISKFFGAQTYMNVYNPTLLASIQGSTSLMYLRGGRDDAPSDISVGWSVYPPRYGDNRTHLFTYWTGNDGKTTGCYDLLCPGFVLTNPNFGLGIALPISTYLGPQYDLKLVVTKDPNTANWWFIINDVRIGYWPQLLFGQLFQIAKELSWGGEVFCPVQPCPPMGSGHFPEEGVGAACYCRMVNYQYELGGDFVDPEYETIGAEVDNPNCYKAGDLTDRGGYWGATFFFGGPGGQC